MVVGDVTGNIGELVLGMEWNQQDQRLAFQSGDGLCVKVMTDEQVELLRQQISVYTAICEKLVETHSALTAQQDLAGMRLGNLYCESLMTYAGQKITARQRWTPTPRQLQILEHMFDQGNGTPSKQKIKEIATELSQHGPISETNVYNWFQNRRARSKRKQSIGVPHNVESEAEAEVDSPKEKKTKLENIHPLEKSASTAENAYIRSPELSAEVNYFDMQPNKGESTFPSDHGSLGSLDHSVLYESVPRMDHFVGKMEDPGSFDPYHYGEGYNIIG